MAVLTDLTAYDLNQVNGQVQQYAPATSALIDQFGRQKRKLRISVTDRCNFKCQYCMPEHPEWLSKSEILSFEALYLFCEMMVEQGIESIRITGGEPLMRQNLVHFIASLNQLRAKGLKRISMTTNAHYLVKYASALKLNGLDDINVSLDSLDATQFEQLTKKQLAPVLKGIQAAQQAGLQLKLNTVLMHGINDDQILPLIHWAKAQHIPIRFIEYMPLDGDARWQKNLVVPEADILAIVAQHFEITPVLQHHEPARCFLLDGDYAIGIISTISHSFCGECDRLRLTATGEFFTCLFAETGIALKPHLTALLQSHTAHETDRHRQILTEHIKSAVWHKAAGYVALQRAPVRKISMHALGG